MRKYYSLIVAAAIICLGGSGSIVDAAPKVDVGKDAVIVSNGDHSLTIHLADSRLTLKTQFHTYALRTSINQPGTWVEPQHAISKPVVQTSKDFAHIEAEFPVVDNRRFMLKVDAYGGIPGFFITSSLKNLGGPRQEYFFWSWEGGYDNYFVPGDKGFEKREPIHNDWGRFGYSDWTYLPGQDGGLAVCTNGTLGRGPDSDKSSFINALPNYQYLVRGQSLDIGFGIAGAASPADAGKIYSNIRSKKIPALFSGPAAAKSLGIDYGKPAPKWVRDLEVYNIFPWLVYAPKAWTDQEIHDWLKPFPLMEEVPHDKAIIARCHKAGVKVVSYINFYELLNSEVQLKDPKGRGYYDGWAAIAGHELVDLKDHPDWISYYPDGKPHQSAWGSSNDIPGLTNVCLHNPEIIKAALLQTKMIMDLGVDGVFIDCAADIPECYGDKLGKHVHIDKRSNTAIYEELERKIYELVKSYGDDKVVMQNSGILPDHWAYCDVQMWESCMFGSGREAKMHTWSDLDYAWRLHSEAVKHGKVPIILSYFMDQPQDRIRECALYTYAYARICNFAWGDWFTMMGKSAEKKMSAELYSAKLGKSKGEAIYSGNVIYRLFENGVAILNPAQSAAMVDIKTVRSGRLRDVCYNRSLISSQGKLAVGMEPESGRVLLWEK